jgi:hypothetical protein
MGKLQRIELMKVPGYDDRMIEGLIELREKHGVSGTARRIVAHLIDRGERNTTAVRSVG